MRQTLNNNHVMVSTLRRCNVLLVHVAALHSVQKALIKLLDIFKKCFCRLSLKFIQCKKKC